MVEIETERLVLRPLEEADTPVLTRLFADPEVMRYSHAGVQGVTYVKQFIERVRLQYETVGYGALGLELKQSGELIGFMGLVDVVLEGRSEVQLAYRVLREFWGQGLATEAGLALKAYAFGVLQLPQIISIIPLGNQASIQVAKKLGMSPERRLEYGGWESAVYGVSRPA